MGAKRVAKKGAKRGLVCKAKYKDLTGATILFPENFVTIKQITLNLIKILPDFTPKNIGSPSRYLVLHIYFMHIEGMVGTAKRGNTETYQSNIIKPS